MKLFTQSRAQISDHFDGKKFFNPEHPDMPGFGSTLKLMKEFRPSAWPELTKAMQPQIPSSVAQGEAVLTFVNHATMLIQLTGLNVLTDPVWSKRASPFTFAGPARRREPGVKIDQLPKIDLILVSHNHYDHLDIATLQTLYKRDKPQILVAFGDQELLHRHGIPGAQEMEWWQSVQATPNTKVTFTPTQHFSARGLFDRNHSLWGAYMLEHDGFKIYFGGDAGYSGYYKKTYEKLGAPDIALIPIGAYEPRWFMKTVHMNPEEAVQAHQDLQAKKSIAIHFGTFALTNETPQQAVADLKTALAAKNITEKDFIVMREGQTEKFPR